MPERKNQKVAPSIQIKGARVHNLKNITIEIPRNQLVVVTGVSGSGKSSLAFDTLYAEGQRRYVESLSSYARQFMGRMDKPEVDYINGISPAIAIEQKVNTRNPRSTVGTSTEIYDYLKLLFARIGKTISPVSGQQVVRHTVEDVVAFLQKVQPGSRALLFAPTLLHPGRSLQEEFSILLQKGFSRVSVLGTIKKLDELLISENKDELIKLSETLGLSKNEVKTSKSPGKKNKKNEIEIITQPKRNEHLFTLIDRFVVDLKDETNLARISDSAQTAFFEGMGELMLQIVRDDGSTENVFFNNRFESDGITFEEPSTQLFSFNNPYGACKKCEGFGSVMGIDEDLVIPDKSLSVYESAIACWRGEKMKEWNDALIRHAYKFDFPIHPNYIQWPI